ncbi:hypothetical protein WICANDRAFT_82062 [Wickerhamomyces anomalus NRRL Y-366-8]|uniref:Uncharacterized protein n=1 Tax=Wickerhamomyces anomalus (strain ATCC 58044 / CBS 1984 / NCYC 433 / NRRL Y-366-8) TaxID=683960 RepID=A0A1E3P9K0_WICAA|nr:uncharacterized protein WICANDRAFT_82062 [Wickerhamomyces anomalus NRRL Y-366-8]ODQ61894.1 hypothetical protein WICANDRAFT_82062 [Wickerhamomyces anomalus NRRL Y-366-8]
MESREINIWLICCLDSLPRIIHVVFLTERVLFKVSTVVNISNSPWITDALKKTFAIAFE